MLSILALLLVAAGAAAQSPFAPPPSAEPSGTPAPAIVWDSGEVKLTADAIRITAGGQVYTSQGADVLVEGDPGSATYRTLEVSWTEHGRPMRLSIYLAADRNSWWITEIRTYDGSQAGDWITHMGPFPRTPIGGVLTRPVRLQAQGGLLEIAGMALRAFSLDTIPAELRNCRPAIAPGTGDDVDPLAEGQLLAGTGLDQVSPAQAKGILLALGVCHMFNYSYQYTDDPSAGYGERWCDPPPGVIRDVLYGGDGEVLVFVEDAVPQQHSPRPQPPMGWGC